jgi:uncharacterized protein (TIGR00725 family)
MKKTIISVVGDARIEEEGKKHKLALNLGKKLIDTGKYRILTGGGGVIMKAVCAGARQSERYQEGDTIAISPGGDLDSANQLSDIIIPTNLGNYRNFIVANSQAVIGIGGGAGTLTELAMAWKLKRLVIGYQVAGWSGKLAGKQIDDRVRYQEVEDKVFSVERAGEVIEILNQYLEKYIDVQPHNFSL